MATQQQRQLATLQTLLSLRREREHNEAIAFAEEMSWRCRALASELEQLHSQAETDRQRAEDALLELEAVRSARDEFKMTAEDLSEQLARLPAVEEALESETRERRQLQGDLLSTRRQLEAAEEAWGTAEQRMRAAEEREQQAAAEASEARSERSEAVAQLHDLRIHLELMLKDLGETRRALHEAEEQRDAGQASLSGALADRAAMQSSLEGKQHELSTLADRLRGEEALRRLDTRELHELRRSLSELTVSRDALEARAVELDAALHRALTDLADRSEQAASALARATEAESRCRDLETMVGDLEAVIERTDRSLQLAEAQAQALGVRLEGVLRELARMSGDEAALKECGIEELEGLMGVFEKVAPLVRGAMLQAKEREVHEAQQCFVCLTRRRDTALTCGHVLCGPCAGQVTSCPVCRADVQTRTRVWW